MRFAPVLTILLVPLLACGSSTNDAAPAMPDASAPSTASDAGETATGATEQGVVAESQLDASGTQVGIVNANVCIEGHPEVPCATSDANGTYSIMIPFLPVASGAPTTELAITAKAEGHLGCTRLAAEAFPATLWPENQILRTDTNAIAFATAAGFTYPTTTTGFVSVRIGGTTAAELVTATATISTGGAAVYGAADGTPDRSLTATTSSGAIYFGNVPPGAFTVTLAAPGKTCSVSPSVGTLAGDWPAPVNTVRGLAVAGSETIALTAFCK